MIKTVREGHKYQLTGMGDPEHIQEIQFIEKVKGDNNDLITLHEGTTNEDVIQMLLDRVTYLDGKFPCKENKECNHHLMKALQALNSRTAKRKGRGVEGKHVL